MEDLLRESIRQKLQKRIGPRQHYSFPVVRGVFKIYEEYSCGLIQFIIINYANDGGVR